jgi:hypothetical protein
MTESAVVRSQLEELRRSLISLLRDLSIKKNTELQRLDVMRQYADALERSTVALLDIIDHLHKRNVALIEALRGVDNFAVHRMNRCHGFGGCFCGLAKWRDTADALLAEQP